LPQENLPGDQELSAQPDPIASIVTSGITQIEESMSRFQQDLRLLCLTESPSDDKAGLNKMAEELALLLQPTGMQTEIIEHPRGNAVVGSLEGSNPTAPVCLLIGHHDTVHPCGVAEARTYVDGNIFYGPGTVDMKAGLLQGIYALQVLKQQGYTDFQRILFLSVPDEEISTRYHVGLIRQLAQGQPLVFGLEGARSMGNVVLRRKGSVQYRLTAEGVASHAGSTPKLGRNAVLELAHQIIQAQQFMDWREGMTINAGPIRGGSRPNIVSDFAEIIFDLRFQQPQDRPAAEAQWQTFLSQQLVPGVKLTLQPEPDTMPPMAETAESLAIAQQVKVIAERFLHRPFDPETRGGASDCCNTSAAGCPTVDGLGAIGKGAHTAHEHIVLSPVPKRVALLAGLLVAMTHTK
jgi:glutamate carboxypeptidase